MGSVLESESLHISETMQKEPGHKLEKNLIVHNLALILAVSINCFLKMVITQNI